MIPVKLYQLGDSPLSDTFDDSNSPISLADLESSEDQLSPELEDLFDPAVLNSFPTPPYQQEDHLKSMSTSPDASLRKSVDSDSLFGELEFSADVFLGSAQEPNEVQSPVSNMMNTELNVIEDSENDKVVDSFVNEVDGLDLTFIEKNLPNASVEGQINVDNEVENSEVINSLASDTDSEASSTSPVPVTQCREIGGKLGSQKFNPAIHMVTVSQYEQGVAKELPRPRGQRQIVAKKTLSNENNRSCISRKKENSVESVDIGKVPPSRRAAVQAKLNREKKKAFIKELEDERDHLLQENQVLSSKNHQLVVEKRKLAEEAAYLRRVLMNDSQLAGLLQNIGNTPSVRLSSTIMGSSNSTKDNCQKRTSDSADHDYVAKKSKVEQAGSSGICLHVDQGNVSVEFCRHCAAKSHGFDVL